MITHTPDKWVLLNNLDMGLYKVFATWSGGWVAADSWRLNSGIEKYTEDESYYYFQGFSGSVYKCGKGSYGVTGAGNYPILEHIVDAGSFTVLEEDEVQHKLQEDI